jgi:hypothetical protein
VNSFVQTFRSHVVAGKIMKKAAFLAIAFGMFVFPAQAKVVHLEGGKADNFIAKHFPNAVIPGDVNGRFTYVAKGHKHIGRAHCHVPAMGERSDGVFSTCNVEY